jgi:radical SAM superfamily enzyme YgiQ (UPF0313 family)
MSTLRRADTSLIMPNRCRRDREHAGSGSKTQTGGTQLPTRDQLVASAGAVRLVGGTLGWQRRGASGSQLGEIRRQTEMSQDALHRAGLLDERQEPQPAAAPRALEHIDPKRSLRATAAPGLLNNASVSSRRRVNGLSRALRPLRGADGNPAAEYYTTITATPRRPRYHRHEMPQHSKGCRARVLLSSVFKPFAQDDEFGSRAINPVELYHNQVTREQGPFSLRMFHRSWSLMFLQQNITAPCTVLDFPTSERFVRELTAHDYDIVGLTSIIVNVGKVREMCRLIRTHSPQSTIVVGGHVTAIPGIEGMIDADHIVKGEGVAWLRQFLGENVGRPMEHPMIPSSFGFRLMGVRLPSGGGNASATIIPSVGCPLGCNFCTTSEFFGGKGKFVSFFERGEDLFKVMCETERRLGATAFFMMDENFLLYKKRALELLDLMKAHNKVWSLYVFSSANAIRKYDVRQLVELGIEWIWLGLESEGAGYVKLQGTDTQELARTLQEHGIRVHGSTIIGLEHHTPGNIDAAIDYAVAHETVFHQFMLYTPVPGTPLYRQVHAEGRLVDDVDLADIHGQYRFNFRHPAISADESKTFLDRAFRRDFDSNGPSLYRLMRNMMVGWRRYRHDPDSRVRARVANEARQLRTGYGAALWAMEKYLRESNRAVSDRIRELRLQIEREMGGFSRVIDRTIGPVLLWSARRETRCAPAGRRLEPRTFVDRRNWVR